jgi:hypothetical protein
MYGLDLFPENAARSYLEGDPGAGIFASLIPFNSFLELPRTHNSCPHWNDDMPSIWDHSVINNMSVCVYESPSATGNWRPRGSLVPDSALEIPHGLA